MTEAGDRPHGSRHAAATVRSRHHGSTLFVTLAGDLAADTVPGLDLLASTSAPLTQRVEVDTSGVDFVDGAGLRMLLRARHECTGLGIGFTLRRPGAHLQWLMDLTGTTELLIGTGDPPPLGRRVPPVARPRPPAEELDERGHTAADRELLADEREKLLNERQQQVDAHEEWEDIREDLANQRENDLHRRESRIARDRNDPDR
jgi:anti-anti-sigma factor